MLSIPKVAALSLSAAIAVAGFLASAQVGPGPDASTVVVASAVASKDGSCERQTWPYLAAECMAPGSTARKPVRTIR